MTTLIGLPTCFSGNADSTRRYSRIVDPTESTATPNHATVKGCLFALVALTF